MNPILFFLARNPARKHSGVDAHASVLFCTLSQRTIPRAWASSTPPTCAALDGRAPKAKLGQPGRRSLRCRGGSAQNSVEIGREYFHHEGKSSCVHQKGILPSRLMKCGAMHFNRMQRIACRRSRSAPLAVSGQQRLPKIGRTMRACSPAWQNTGLQATEFQTRGAWRSSVSLREYDVMGCIRSASVRAGFQKDDLRSPSRPARGLSHAVKVISARTYSRIARRSLANGRHPTQKG
jgi:hypothetical protein